jgi:catechol 2,3-dioxygenase-like lactoylglutathione lyase family enzyme
VTYQIDHIGFIVPDLEEAIRRWQLALGYEFAPITRYRTDRWSDRHTPALHHHDARKTISREGPPRIELLEATGEGTHSLQFAGPHHVGIRGIEDIDAVRAEMAAKGFTDDGVSTNDDGEVLLFFTEAAALDGMRIEFVSTLPGKTVADDGRELPVDPATGRADVWAEPIGPAA